MTDELFDRLRASDPQPSSAPVSPHDGPEARTLLEAIMSTDIHAAGDDHATGPVTPPPRRRLTLVLAGIGVAAVAAVGVAAAMGAFTSTEDELAVESSLTVTLPASDPMAMCLAIGEYQPSADAAAFAGHVTDVGDGTVTVEVDQWYQGGDADLVVITASDTGMSETGIEGTALVDGADLLVTVIDGQVQTCGISAGASPELEAFYDTWYG